MYKTAGSIESAIARAGRQVELLQEYRTRLIADMVTAKPDARQAASELSEESESEVPIDTIGLMADNERAGLESAPRSKA